MNFSRLNYQRKKYEKSQKTPIPDPESISILSLLFNLLKLNFKRLTRRFLILLLISIIVLGGLKFKIFIDEIKDTKEDISVLTSQNAQLRKEKTSLERQFQEVQNSLENVRKNFEKTKNELKETQDKLIALRNLVQKQDQNKLISEKKYLETLSQLELANQRISEYIEQLKSLERKLKEKEKNDEIVWSKNPFLRVPFEIRGRYKNSCIKNNFNNIYS